MQVMLCIAAFIVLLVLGVFIAFLSIFKPQLGRSYWKIFKKSWSCVARKATFRKCDTNFKDDVKNTILSKVALKHPRLLKPLSFLVEIIAILIVFITIWSLIIALKSLLALWALGSCNVQHPAKCSLVAATCSIETKEPQNVVEAFGRSLADWQEIFMAIPDRFRSYDIDSLGLHGLNLGKPTADRALSVFDPGCIVCLRSYRAQKQAGFFDRHHTLLAPYVIVDESGRPKFPNSDLIAAYFLAAIDSGQDQAAAKLIARLFGENDPDAKVTYQQLFAQLSPSEAESLMQTWLHEFQLSQNDIDHIISVAHSSKIQRQLEANRQSVTKNLHARVIPVMLYDGKKHNGLYKQP